MGGRGAYTEGKQEKYVYSTVDEIEGVKVLAPVDDKASHSMPAEAHSSRAYIVLDKENGVFRQYREFNTYFIDESYGQYHILDKDWKPISSDKNLLTLLTSPIPLFGNKSFRDIISEIDFDA